MDKKKFSLSRKIKFTIVILVLFLSIITLIGEVVVRLFFNEKKEYSDKSIMDKTLGWLPKENYSSTYKMTTFGDNPIEYDVNYKTAVNGFRFWGDPNSSKPKVFFIGDSYVQSVEVSNDKTFYGLVGDSLGIEVFAFGQAGYGTLQQKIILSRYLDIIKPDLIILETCDNDFIDNYAPLEYNSKYKVGLRRPYYNLDGTISYRRPMPKWQEVVDKSKFLELLRKKIKFTFAPKNKKSTEGLIAELKDQYKPYAKSLEITSKVLSDIKIIAGDIPIIAFSSSAYEPQLTDFKQIAESANIPYYDKIGKEIQELSWHKKKVYSRDGYHWSEDGHMYVSNLLIAILIEKGFIIKSNMDEW